MDRLSADIHRESVEQIMIFKDRADAGRELAKRLGNYANRADTIVLGIPRGGVAVAFEVAQALHLPLDIFLSRKLGVPGQEELAFGAIAANDGRFLDEQVIRATGISEQQIESITEKVKETLQKRAVLYRGTRPALRVEGLTVILVDDGIATGASAYAAIRALREMKPARLIVAVPVAPASTCAWLRDAVDELVCPCMPKNFYAVGQYYVRFRQVTDEEVTDLLRRAERQSGSTDLTTAARTVSQSEISINLGSIRLWGTLSLPAQPKGIVLFAHGSGSSRHSPRNQYVAEVLHSHGIATLLFDLLTEEEELVDRRTADLRFDIELLAERLIGVTKQVKQHAFTRNLAIAYFGASTGAAAALVAAAQLPDLITAVVSRGGRPDLAAEVLGNVRASVLLIVGGRDEMVIRLNQRALTRLQCQNKQLVIIPGATHLFEEEGTLEQAAHAAAEWFDSYFAPGQLSKGSGVSKMSGVR